MNTFAQNKLKALLFFLLLGTHISLFAQDSTRLVIGVVRNSTDYSPISFAIVGNQMLKTKVVSDENGRYIIPFNQGDLLKITAIGFEDGFYIVNDTSKRINDFPIQLKPRIYELDEFTIAPYKTVLLFKKALLELELPDTNLLVALGLPEAKYIPPPTPGSIEIPIITINGPITKLYNLFSHQGKMEKKYQKLVTNDYKSNLVKTRLNRILIKELIPIKTTEELEDFIAFCHFDFSFILKASDYELIAALQKKYSEYKNIKLL